MNRFSKLSLLWLAGGMALAFMAPAVAAPTLTFKFAAINIPGSIDVNAYGVSESGVVVGEYLDTAGASHGFILKGKTVTEVNDSKGLATFCQGISPNGGTVVGYYINSTVAVPLKNCVYDVTALACLLSRAPASDPGDPRTQ